MSSETSTKRRRRSERQLGTSSAASSAETATGEATPTGPNDAAADREGAAAVGLQPWHLFVIATLLASSATALAVRGTSPANVIFLCLTVMTAGIAAYAVYRALAPLVLPGAVETPEMLGGRTRAALEREKTLVLRSIKELEFDRAMGKVSETDWQEMTARLRSRAVRLIRQLDSGSAAYRDLIEKELVARRASAGARSAEATRQARAGTAVVLVVALGTLLGASPVSAQMGGMGGAGMPDAKAMSGIPRPTDTVPSGGVSVRLVRGELSNLVIDHPVDFLVDGQRRSVKTGPTGHAVLTGLKAGTVVQAIATVDGERLESQQFEVPAQGGMVLMLVATDKAAQNRLARDATPGTVVLGGQTRIVLQFDDEVLQVFYLLDIVNSAATPVKTSGPLIFAAPDAAQNTSVLEGSAPGAVAKGRRVTLSGPFPPGTTSVQVGFQLPAAAAHRLRLDLPVDYLNPTVIAEKAGGTMDVASAQVEHRQEANDAGKVFVMATGHALKAGQAFEIDITGIPHHAPWPRYVALGLGVLLLAWGVWGAASSSRRTGEAAARQALERRREAIFSELLRLERGRADDDQNAADAETRRSALVSELERIYGELDAEAPGPGRDQGFAA